MLGIVLVGSFSFWGWMCAFKTRRVNDSDQKDWNALSRALLYPALFGSIILGISMLAMVLLEQNNILDGELLSVFLLFIVWLFGCVLAYKPQTKDVVLFEWWYFSQFILLCFFIISPLFIKHDIESISVAIQRFIPIITLGTTLVGSHLLAWKRKILEKHTDIIRAFVLVMFSGVGVLFLHNAFFFSYGDEISINTIFIYILLSIIILNGVLLFEPWINKIESYKLSYAWRQLGLLSGAIFIVSFLCVSILSMELSETMKQLPLSALYLAGIAVCWYGFYLMDKHYVVESRIISERVCSSN